MALIATCVGGGLSFLVWHATATRFVSIDYSPRPQHSVAPVPSLLPRPAPPPRAVSGVTSSAAVAPVLRVRVMTDRGEPIEHASVRLLGSRGVPPEAAMSFLWQPLSETATDSSGTAAFDSVDSESLRGVSAYARGYAARLISEPLRYGGLIEVRLSPDLLITGQVKTADGAAVPGVRIRARGLGWPSMPGRTEVDLDGGAAHDAMSDAQGSFSIEGLQAGLFQLEVAADGVRAILRKFGEPLQTTVYRAGTTAVQLKVEGMRVFKVTFADAATLAPIAYATPSVRVFSPEASHRGFTLDLPEEIESEGGRVPLDVLNDLGSAYVGVVLGTKINEEEPPLEILFDVAGYESGRARVKLMLPSELLSGSHDAVQLRRTALWSAGRVRVHETLSTDGIWLPQSRTLAVHSNEVAKSPQAADGMIFIAGEQREPKVWDFAGVPSGDVKLELIWGSFSSGSRQVRVDPGGLTTLEMGLSEALGYVAISMKRSDNGRPLFDADSVYARKIDGSDSGMALDPRSTAARPGDSGSLLLPLISLPPGHYRMNVTKRGFGAAGVNVDAQAGRIVSAAFNLTPE